MSLMDLLKKMDYSILRKIIRDCFRIDRINYEQTKVLTVAHDNDRSLLYNGKYYSPLIDTMEDDLAKRGIQCISIARIISRIKGSLSHGKVRSPEGRFARALVIKRFIGLISKGKYPYSYMEEAAWGDILDVTKARRVFGIQPSRELCVACHKRGIWVADVQHGVIAERHPWYGAKFRAHDPLEYLPDAFLVWDYGSERVIKKWAHPRGIATKVIGNRWVARFMRQSTDDELVKNLFGKFNCEAEGFGARKRILVSLSWGESNIPNGFICEGLEAVIKKTAHQYAWLIRLHPNQVKGFAEHEASNFMRYFNSVLKGSAEWELATKYPLPVVLQNVDLHISWWSSVCIEAAQFGVKSALLNPRLREVDPIRDSYEYAAPSLTASVHISDYYQYYREKGMIDFVGENECTIESWIQKNAAGSLEPESYDEFDQEYHRLLSFLAE